MSIWRNVNNLLSFFLLLFNMEKDGKLYCNYEEIHNLVKKISGNIIFRDISVDVMVAISTGGWIPAVILRNLLPHSGDLPMPLYSVGMVNYDSENNLLEEPRLLQKLPNLDLSNKTVLVVDEITDSGGTFTKVKEYISSLNPTKIYTVVLHHKEKSKFEPDIIGEVVEDKWIVYPWVNI